MSEEKKSLIERVTELFSDEVIEETFLDVKTSEGVVLRVNEVAEGATVTIISEDGENVSGASEYTLEDGVVIVVDDSGVITSVTEATEEEEEVAEEMAEEEEVAEPTDREIAVDAQLLAITEALEGIVSKFKAQDLRIEEFAKSPADDIEVVVDNKVEIKHSKENALKALARFRTKK